MRPDRLVPIDGRYAELGEEVAGPGRNAADKMRRIYDHVVATMQYDYKKQSPHLGEGDVAFVCDYKMGNCSDLHSYVIALARSRMLSPSTSASCWSSSHCCRPAMAART